MQFGRDDRLEFGRALSGCLNLADQGKRDQARRGDRNGLAQFGHAENGDVENVLRGNPVFVHEIEARKSCGRRRDPGRGRRGDRLGSCHRFRCLRIHVDGNPGDRCRLSRQKRGVDSSCRIG